MLALLTLGEVGWQSDIPSSHPAALRAVEALFASEVEDIKIAAALSLGGLCVGNMSAGLPVLLEYLASGTNTYLLLTSLKVRQCVAVHAVFVVCM